MKIAYLFRVDVDDLAKALEENPQLWDQNTARTAPPESPHHGLSDIWARYAAPGVDGSGPHKSVWYDSALTKPLMSIADELMEQLQGQTLGGVLITRIPPGGECKPHRDPGWHARYYEKIAVQVKSWPGQAFHFIGEKFAGRPGDCYWFDNSHEHWVPNPTQHERITAIFCIKTDLFDNWKDK